jgi:protein gp37
MAKTRIEWADKVWNPVTGCTKVSEGCRNCYAEVIANRFWGERKFTDVQCHPDRLGIPSHWRKPSKIFVNSMSDLFHEDVPDDFIREVFSAMYLPENRKHTFIVLTKRPERMRNMIHYAPDLGNHIWLGVSVENQAAADERIPLLLQTPAAVRFVSVEPMLERVDLSKVWVDYLSGWTADTAMDKNGDPESYQVQTEKLDWVICGGESGVHARPHPPLIDVHFLKEQCVSAGVPFFLKQMWGKKTPELDGQIWDQYPGGE